MKPLTSNLKYLLIKRMPSETLPATRIAINCSYNGLKIFRVQWPPILDFKPSWKVSPSQQQKHLQPKKSKDFFLGGWEKVPKQSETSNSQPLKTQVFHLKSKSEAKLQAFNDTLDQHLGWYGGVDIWRNSDDTHVHNNTTYLYTCKKAAFKIPPFLNNDY